MNRQDWNLLQRIGGPTKEELVACLRDVRDDARGMDEEDMEEGGIDVRLQVLPLPADPSPREQSEGSWWALRSGPSDYDQDHRGCWGASGVAGDMPIRGLCSLEGIAEDLANQVLDMFAEDQEFRSSEQGGN